MFSRIIRGDAEVIAVNGYIGSCCGAEFIEGGRSLDIIRFIVAVTGALLLLMASPVEAAEQPAPRTISDITVLLDQYNPDSKFVEQNRAKAREEPPSSLLGIDLARFFHQRAWAARVIGDAKREIADLRRAVELLPTSNDPERFKHDLSSALLQQGNVLEGIRLRESLSAQATPSNKVGLSGLLTSTYREIGDVEAARASWVQVESGYSGVRASRNPLTIALANAAGLHFYRARGDILAIEGKFDQAEESYRRALGEAVTYLGLAERNIANRTIAPGLTPEMHRELTASLLDTTRLWVARFMLTRNRLDEAELLVREVLQNSLARLGRDNARSAHTMQVFAAILVAQGRYQEASVMGRSAISAFKRAGVEPEARGLAEARRTLGSTLVLQGQWADALNRYDEMRSGLATDPGSVALLGRGDAYWGMALVKSGRAAEAVQMLASRLAEDRKILGESHPLVAFNRGVLGMALAGTGDKQRALAEFNVAVVALLDSGVLAGARSAAQTQLLRYILEGYIELLIEIRDSDLDRGQQVNALSHAFRFADVMRGQSVQGALSASAARAAAGDPAVADLVRKEQDLNEHARALYGYLFNQLSLKPEEQSLKLVGDMRKRLDEIGVERKQLQTELQRHFPRYAEFVNPKPATLEQARAALREGEVLLSVLTTTERTYVWALPKQGAVSFHTADMGETEISRIVGSLRRALDVGEVAITRVPEFDVGQAAKLYETLLKPVEGAWKGAQTLLVVANGALAQLPFGVLLTGPSAATPQALRFEQYKDLPWLIKQIAVAQLPAVNTLVTLRALPQGNVQRTAFAGFGDPQFSAQQAVAPAPAPMQVAMRNMGIRRVTEAALRDGSAPVNYIPYGALPPLPDTREEILAIARALKADISRDVFLGVQASKQSLKKANLANRRIVAFATHGLVPKDFPNLDQPALALASPDGKAESGLLTLEDILQLKLDADWVVLSACNTAAGDGAGAEAISGLGRGFFYAGSRALLVTHWPVETVSAKNLVTKIFERYTADPTLTRAEALRQAHLSVMGENAIESGKPAYSYAHPLFWAPYALVGDGGR